MRCVCACSMHVSWVQFESPFWLLPPCDQGSRSDRLVISPTGVSGNHKATNAYPTPFTSSLGLSNGSMQSRCQNYSVLSAIAIPWYRHMLEYSLLYLPFDQKPSQYIRLLDGKSRQNWTPITARGTTTMFFVSSVLYLRNSSVIVSSTFVSCISLQPVSSWKYIIGKRLGKRVQITGRQKPFLWGHAHRPIRLTTPTVSPTRQNKSQTIQ